MARFQFKVSNIVVNFSERDALSQRSVQALHLDGADQLPQGPGWFDSSWELIHGLEVSDALPFDLGLDEWLKSCVRAADTAHAASAVAQRHEQPGARLVPAAPHGALGHALQLGDLGLAVAAEVAHLDQFSEFGVDGLELL
jgi:hypothetical protein